MTLEESEHHVLNLHEGHTLTGADVDALHVFYGEMGRVRDERDRLKLEVEKRAAAEFRLAKGVAAGHRHLNGHAPGAAPGPGEG